jgi:LPXTG-motif cell wall-anchored protein
MRASRRIFALGASIALAVMLVSALGLGLSAERASATSPVVLVSTDGVTYQPSLSVGLFDNAGLLVPGDTAGAQLWIKNPTTAPATVRVNIGDVSTSSADLADNMRLTAVNTANGSTLTETWSELTQCDIMVQPFTLAAGAVIRIDLTLAMLNAPGLVAQHQNGAMTADVSMRDAAGGSFPISTCDPGTTTPPADTEPAATHPRKVLGYTGETFPTQLLLIGSLLVGTGWFLVAARRRRRREEAQR